MEPSAPTAPADFWQARVKLNSETALPYQWSRYEEVGTVDNFRIAAGMKSGQRRGFFYTDSDLHKWADAASRSLAHTPSEELETLLARYVGLMAAAQSNDGYLYTYNQVCFPGRRWENLLVEHELYCHGHFIEAGIEHSGSIGRRPGAPDLLSLAVKSADLICEEFGRRDLRAPGHQEIEVALLRLCRLTGTAIYRDVAVHFLHRRGRHRFPGIHLARDNNGHEAKDREIRLAVAATPGDTSTPGAADTPGGYDFHETAYGSDVPFIRARLLASFLSGRYMQHHRPVERQRAPTGHAVRWTYMMTAAAMSGNDGLRRAAADGLSRMLDGRTYVSGGIGSLPQIEGFGRKWELNDEFAYCETCAAIGAIFLCSELDRKCDSALHGDLSEWLLYNAASVGIGLDGTSYFYRNPLRSAGGVRRRGWFDTACCPSNISRLWAGLDRLACDEYDGLVRVNQFITGTYALRASGVEVEIESGLPWSGRVSVRVRNPGDAPVRLAMRVPSWSGGGSSVSMKLPAAEVRPVGRPSFEEASFQEVTVQAGEHALNLELEMPITVIEPYRKVRGQRGRVALARGPLLYCLEFPGLTGSKAPDPELRIETARFVYDGDLLDGIGTLRVTDTGGAEHVFVPYYAWGNREDSSMRVWVRSA